MVGVKSVPDAEYRIQTFRRYFVRGGICPRGP